MAREGTAVGRYPLYAHGVWYFGRGAAGEGDFGAASADPDEGAPPDCVAGGGPAIVGKGRFKVSGLLISKGYEI